MMYISRGFVGNW